MDHHLDMLSHDFPSAGRRVSTPTDAASRPTPDAVSRPAASHLLKPGQAITLRAKDLSVLRITHGRVWATLTDVGPYSRVRGGDHFLSRGETLTLLPGQELVMESLGIGHTPTAQFSWENSCAAGIAVPLAAGEGAGVLLPLRDLRHALGLVAGASGRLATGLAHGAFAALGWLAVHFAMVFIAKRSQDMWAGSTCDASKRPY